MLEQTRLACLSFMKKQDLALKQENVLPSSNKNYIDIFELIFFPMLEGKIKIIICLWKPVKIESWVKAEDLKKLNDSRATQHDLIKASRKW